MDDMLYAAVPRKLRVRTSILFGNVRMPLRLFLVLLATGVVGVLLLLAGMGMLWVVSLVVLFNGSIALILEVRWGSHWVSRSTWSVVRIWWRHLRRPTYLRLQPVPVVLAAEPARQMVRPVRWTLAYDPAKEPTA